MPSLFYYLRRTTEQPLRETLNQARALTSERLRSVLQPAYDRVFGRSLSRAELLTRSGYSSHEELLKNVRQRSWPKLTLAIPDAVRAAELLLSRRLNWHVD